MLTRSGKSIGVIGCAAVLPRVLLDPVREIPHLTVQGLSNRTRSKAEHYAQEYGIPVIYSCPEESLASPDIDIVYILLSNELHAEWTVRAIEAGKHVLVEKPLCLTSEEAEKIERAYRAGNVHVLEGLMVQHHPWQQALREMVQSGEYGELREIDTQISFLPKASFEGNYRSFPDKGGGAFYDLGRYWLQFLQAVLEDAPAVWRGQSSFGGPNGCDWTFHAEVQFQDGPLARAVTSFEMPYRASHRLTFERAVVVVDDFFRATLGSYKITLKVTECSTGETRKLLFEPQNYYVNQLNAFSDIIDSLRAPVPLESALERIRLQQQIYQSAQTASKPV
ncbi:Gfo/Idh/MocA family oxidoreductase [Paenibacillus sp. P26]|nr:Gfo/Idh/MocA family oxidoreductase [Paenibacillus sp. P26]